MDVDREERRREEGRGASPLDETRGDDEGGTRAEARLPDRAEAGAPSPLPARRRIRQQPPQGEEASRLARGENRQKNLADKARMPQWHGS